MVVNSIQLASMRGSRNFRQGGPGQSDKKKLYFFFFFFFSPQIILQKSNGQFQRNLSFFKVSEGVQHFPGGGGGSNFFQRGSNCLFPIETHIACDFPGGVRIPCPPFGSALVASVLLLIRLFLALGYWLCAKLNNCMYLYYSAGTLRSTQGMLG